MKRMTRAFAKKVLQVVDAGLVRGMGKPVAGQMCVEAAVCFALGEPHGDQPSCVGSAVRAFKIRLNDSLFWPSEQARAQGLRKLAVAQLGSDKLNQQEFATQVTLKTIREILPPLLRRRKLEKEALACEVITTLREGEAAAKKAQQKLKAAANVAAAAVYAANAAVYAANAPARADANAAANAAAAAAANAAANAANAAANAAAAAAANAAANAAADAGHEVLLKSAAIGVQVLIDLKSPGAAWLDLCE